MSSQSPHELHCSHCGNKQETMIWDSLNVTLDPDLKKKLYAAEINQFNCEKCKKTSFINAPLLYHDMTQEFCVQYYPPEALQDANFFRQFKSDGSRITKGLPAKLAKKTSYLLHPHIVFDLNEMIRYVAFRDILAGLNKAESSEQKE